MTTTENKIEMMIYGCPWCKKAPVLNVSMGTQDFIVRIYCNNHECPVRPEINPNIVCNPSKEDRLGVKRLEIKIIFTIDRWNWDNPVQFSTIKEIDIKKVFGLIKKGNSSECEII